MMNELHSSGKRYGQFRAQKGLQNPLPPRWQTPRPVTGLAESPGTAFRWAPLAPCPSPLLSAGSPQRSARRLLQLMERAKKPRTFPAERTGHPVPPVPPAAPGIEFGKISRDTPAKSPRRKQGSVVALCSLSLPWLSSRRGRCLNSHGGVTTGGKRGLCGVSETQGGSDHSWRATGTG